MAKSSEFQTQPGVHPNFDLGRYEVSEQRVLRRLSQLAHLTRSGIINLTPTVKYNYALIRPAGQLRWLLNTDREVMIVFSPYTDFQSRTLDAFDRILAEIKDEFRIEKVARLLVSQDLNVTKKLKDLFKSKPDAPVVIPFYVSDISNATSDSKIAERIREFTYSRDLFSMSSPLRNDMFFYGRSGLINEICSKLSSGENFGLFGLRRSGKTSIVAGLERALPTRAGVGVVIDCQNPAIHQRRWYELLEYIAISAKEVLNSSIKLSRSSKYNEKDAANVFLRDLRALKKQSHKEFIAILFDEVERISFGTASSTHWNDERDFLHFWQAVRFGFQSSQSPFTFLIVGTNPSAVERTKIFESDNPLYGNVEKRFIPMFTENQVSEMVEDLGAIMGITFDGTSKTKLFTGFGGHPFLTRYACSHISATGSRPLNVDRTIYKFGISKFNTESEKYVESVVGLLAEEYEDEHEMLKYLGHDDSESFNTLARLDPSLCEHLIGYGLVSQGEKSHYFNIGIVENYFKELDQPTELMTQQNRTAEVSERRNELEKGIRSLIKSVFQVSFPAARRAEEVKKKLCSSRREALQNWDFDTLLCASTSPLFFDELRSIILGNWSMFENIIGIPKGEFDFYMSIVNKFRVDAHAKDISEHDFNKWRLSICELKKIISQ